MSKLLQLKQWLTLHEAARTLSQELGEAVLKSDVLHLAVVGQLRLSVRFVNRVYGNVCRPFDSTADEWEDVPPLLPGSRPVRLPKEGTVFAAPDGRDYLATDRRVPLSEPVYDLPMIGGEKGDVEHAYQQAIGGVEVTDSWIDGVFLMSGERLFLLLDCRPHPDSPGRLHYFPAGGLPDDSTLVVRPDELDRFIAVARGSGLNEPNSSKELAAREKTTLLNIIGGLIVLMQGRKSVWKDQAAIVRELMDNYAGWPGIARSTIDAKFAEANKSLEQTSPH